MTQTPDIGTNAFSKGTHWELLGRKYRSAEQRISARKLESRLEDGNEQASVTADLEKAVVEQAKALTRGSDLLFHVLLQAAMILVMRRWHKSDSYCLGTAPQARSKRPDGASLLPIVVSVDDETTGVALLQSVRSAYGEAVTAQTFSREELATALGRADPTRPLVELGVAFEPLHGKRDAAHMLREASVFIKAARISDTIAIELHYLTDRYLRAEAELVLSSLQSELKRLLRDTALPIGAWDGVTREDRELLDRQDAQAGVSIARDNFSMLFKRQASSNPLSPAILWNTKSYSYQELDRASNALAGRLAEIGTAGEVIVGLYVDRTPEMLAGLLAILKSGGTYLPLDPTHPADRIAHMLQEANCPIVMTSRDHRGTLPDGVKPILLDGAFDRADAPVAADPTQTWQPLKAEYCLYTSGSTGKPKGVLVTQDGLTNYLIWARDAYGVTAETTSIVHSPLVFDLTVTSLLLPLIAGGCVRLLPFDADVSDLQDAMIAFAGPHLLLKLTPSHLKAMSPDFGSRDETDTRRITFIVGGEDLKNATADPWLKTGRCEVFNEYGPTETVVGCIVLKAGEDPELGRLMSMPIGSPIANTRIYLLDEEMSRVGHGKTGEIFIGGPGVARGYTQRPALTAERFVPNPFLPDGSRLYRTGDMARYLPDGKIEYLGRIDDQVKIRGHRIEIGEIEAAVRLLPSVADAVVICDQDDLGEARLVAYAVIRDGHGFEPDKIRDGVKIALPSYMVPAHLMQIDEIPITSNGKVDRGKLPAWSEPEKDDTTVENPGNPEEAVLVQIWKEVLKRPSVGIDDDFFALGGHSLLATRIVFLIRKRTDVQLRVSDILRYPTIRTLAPLLGKSHASEASIPSQSGDASMLHTDIRLPSSLSFEVSRSRTANGNILMTGATGFLGRYLLAECLNTTNARIICIVRAADHEAARRRVLGVLAGMDLAAGFEDRLEVMAGDLGLPDLGMTTSDYAHIAETPDTILHNGAYVNFFAPYADLRRTNVVGTLGLLQLAGEARTKAFHHISSLSALSVGPDIDGIFTEQTKLPTDPSADAGGYVLSKWAAEQLVTAAHQRDLPGSVYRLGLITGHSSLGAFNGDDLVYRAIRAVSELGAVPSALWRFKLMPVDLAARGIVRLMSASENGRETYHVDGIQTVSIQDFADRMRMRGMAIKTLERAEWKDALGALASTGENANAAALYAVIENATDDHLGEADRTSSAKTQSALRALGVSYPTFGNDHLDATLDFLDEQLRNTGDQ